MLNSRPDDLTYFLAIATVAATKATCNRAQVGVALVKDRHCFVTGYNGAPPGKPHCIDVGVGCLMVDGHCVRTVHAEANAIAQAALHGHSTRGAIAYCTHEPCLPCSMLLESAGIVAVYWKHDYADHKRDAAQATTIPEPR